jgi:transcriptional regulator with GAF, ATPase, and Fis domain
VLTPKPQPAQAVQVADRWQLWHNLAGHLERVVLAHRRCLRELPPPEHAGPVLDVVAGADATTDTDTSRPELWIVTRTRERYQTITALRAAGKSIAQVARELGLDRRTVRRFARPPARRNCSQEPPASHAAR